MKKLTSSLLLLALIAVFVAPAGLATAKAKKPAGPVVVATDDAGDWGANVDPTIAPAGTAIGQELVEATIGMADAKTVNFVIKLAGLPPTGGIPEGARYSWDFTVNDDAFSMSGNFTDYLRGICYPPHTGSCPPPKDPGQQPFYIRQGPCTISPTAASISDCTLMATVKATFDTATATITIPVPLDVIKAKAGSKIGPGTNSVFGATIYATPAAVTANTAAPHDTMVATGTFTVPKGK